MSITGAEPAKPLSVLSAGGARRLPRHYLVTPPFGGDDFVARFSRSLGGGIRLAVFRDYALDDDDYLAVLRRLVAAAGPGAAVLAHNRPPAVSRAQAAGVHLSAAMLADCEDRPVPHGLWFAASCHNWAELEHARRTGADFATLGPVRRSASHPAREALGWDGFGRLAARAGLPVYAIGGMRKDDDQRSRECGGQGVAAIRGLWNH